MFWKLINMIKGLFYFTGTYSVNVFLDPLSAEDEKKYIERMMNGDKDARNKLIEHNLRLVAHIVKRFQVDNIPNDDLISIGTIGLIKGIDSYSPSKNIKITTYAAKCIENEILMFFRTNNKHCNNVSLNDSIGIDKDGNDITLMDVIVEEQDDLNTIIFRKMNIEALHEYLKALTKREKDIIVKRYGLYNSDIYTQKELAKALHISRSYVSRIEKRALSKLYKEFYKKNRDKTVS